jgi:predicted nucleic acid-binding protein
VTLYLDTSSLVKLYVTEPGSENVRAHVERATIVATSMIAYPETRAAFARRRREGALRPAAFVAAKRQFESDWPKYVAMHVTDAICRDAGQLAERYSLRGYDSVHLASFLEIARAAGADTKFSTFDDRLDEAARLAARGRRRART